MVSNIIKQSSVHQTVCLSVPSISSSSRRWPVGLLLRSGMGLQQISINSCCYCATCRPRKFWSDCEKVQHTCQAFYYNAATVWWIKIIVNHQTQVIITSECSRQLMQHNENRIMDTNINNNNNDRLTDTNITEWHITHRNRYTHYMVTYAYSHHFCYAEIHSCLYLLMHIF